MPRLMAGSSTEPGVETTLVGQLEEQLDALGRTKQELRSVRTDMVALEHELYRMSAANEELQRRRGEGGGARGGGGASTYLLR